MTVDAPGPASDKQLVYETIRRMPDDVTLQQICEEIALLAAIRRGEAASAAGRVLLHEEVKSRAATWTTTP